MKTFLNSLLALGLISSSLISNAQCDSSFAAYFTALDQGGNIAVFNGSSNLPANGFYWDFGDGNSGYGSFTQHFYQQPGSYFVCLEVWYWDQNTQDTCWATTCQMVVVGSFSDPCDSLLDASFTWIENLGTVAFTENSFNNGIQTTYFWQFGDGSTSADQNPVHTYLQNGQYFVCLDVHTIDQNGYQCSDSLCTFITISGLSDPCDSLLNAYFTPLQLQGNAWSFNNGTWSVDQNATSFWWDFGDGSTSTDNIPTHTYSTAGVYTVCLIAQVWNCLDTFCLSVTVPNSQSCDSTFVAGFSWTNAFNNVVAFADGSNTSGQQAYYYWSFGDGASDYTSNPVHTYSVPGQYYVCLDLWYWNQNTQDTCWSSYCDWIFVQGVNLDCDSVPHVADFSYFANTTWVNFYDQSILSGNNATYYWDFGDGSSSTDQNPFHQYSQSGAYIVCLYTAIGINNGADSCFSSICDTVWVSSFSDCDSTFSANFSGTSSGNVVFFTDLSNTAGQQAYYVWNFGDGTYDYTPDPIHTFSGPGQYFVCLDVWYWNQNAQDTCWSSYCEWVVVQGGGSICDSIPHVADYSYSSSGLLVDFLNQSITSGYAANSYWDLGDGSISYAQDPLHLYAQSGSYIVCLYSEIGPNNGADSCFSAFCDTVVVNIPGGGCDSTFNASYTYSMSSNIGFFTDQSNTAGQQAFYIWNFGDGSYDYSPDPIHTFAGPGQYFVCLDVWYWNQNAQDTCWSSYCEWVVVQGGGSICDSIPHVADYSYSSSGLLVDFLNQSITSGYAANSYWDLGDGSISYAQDPLHLYAQSGSYIVCLYSEIGPNNGADSCFSAFCDTIVVPSQNTSVSENILSSISLTPFPNPGNGAILFSPEPYLKNLSLRVVDLRGRVLSTFEKGALSQGVLDIRHFETGVYLFIFELDSSRRTERYILER